MTGLEFLINIAANGIANLITESVWNGESQFLKKLGKTPDEKTQLSIAAASQQYAQNYAERHGVLKVLGMREPVNLESVYTAVQFLDKQDARRFESLETLEQLYRQDRSRGFQPRDGVKREGLRVANQKQYLMILGGPGAGKSTFLRKMGLEALKGVQGDYEHPCIPVFIELKGFTAHEVNIERAIIEEFRICGLPHPEESTTSLLGQGRLLILLDGLDEVPAKNVSGTIGQIQDFVDRHDKNRYIASCRAAAYRHNFRRFTDVVMAHFDNIQIKQFIYNWFHSEEDRRVGTAQKCWEILQKPENAAAKELAHTPLLLTLLCLVYDRSQNFPNNRSVLYRKALRVFLEEWASEKRILRDEIYQGLSIELEEILLAELAYKGFEIDQLFFSKREVVRQIKDFLESNLNAPRHLNGEAILNAIAVQQGILVERAQDVFSFSHLTIQEYLSAQHITDFAQVEQLVADHLTEKRWHEVFLLVAGLMRGGADQLLLRMEKAAQQTLNDPQLQGLLQWAELVTDGSEGHFKPAAKRAIALFLALTCDYTLDLACVLNPNLTPALTLARTLTRSERSAFVRKFVRDPLVARTSARAFNRAFVQEFEKIKVLKDVNFTTLIARLEAMRVRTPDPRQPPEVHQAFDARISQIWFHALQINRALVPLSDAQLQALETHLNLNLLIVRCKQAAVRVSPKVWEGIEERMLRLSSE